MAAPRLSDDQKQELVSRFRGGAGTQELAAAYGCSPNTVSRVVRAAIEPALYEELKRQRGRRAGQASDADAAAPASNEPAAELSPQPVAAEAPVDPGPVQPESAAASGPAAADIPDPVEPPDQDDQPEPESDSRDHEAARALAIDDAEDFDGFEDEDEEQDDEDDGADVPEQTFVEVPVSLVDSLDQPFTTPRPWRSDELPASAYMLVDKTVELQALPLADIPELGRLEAAELELQALVLYSNPRQAKRHCGRTQRVIKIPDVGVLERRAPYLLRQGIRRVVVEGALYALPEG